MDFVARCDWEGKLVETVKEKVKEAFKGEFKGVYEEGDYKQ